MSEDIWTAGRLKVRPEWIDNESGERSKQFPHFYGVEFTDAAPPILAELLDETYNGTGPDYYPDDSTLCFDGEMNYGYGGDYNDALVELGISFVIKTDAKYEYDGDVWFWVPGMAAPENRGATEGGVVLGAAEWQALRKEFLEPFDRHLALVQAIDRHFVDPWTLVDTSEVPPPYEPEEA